MSIELKPELQLEAWKISAQTFNSTFDFHLTSDLSPKEPSTCETMHDQADQSFCTDFKTMFQIVSLSTNKSFKKNCIFNTSEQFDFF